jgi:hypothetical protein
MVNMTTNQETKLTDILEEALSAAERLSEQSQGMMMSVAEAERRHDEIKTLAFKSILKLLEV